MEDDSLVPVEQATGQITSDSKYIPEELHVPGNECVPEYSKDCEHGYVYENGVSLENHCDNGIDAIPGNNSLQESDVLPAPNYPPEIPYPIETGYSEEYPVNSGNHPQQEYYPDQSYPAEYNSEQVYPVEQDYTEEYPPVPPAPEDPFESNSETEFSPQTEIPPVLDYPPVDYHNNTEEFNVPPVDYDQQSEQHKEEYPPEPEDLPSVEYPPEDYPNETGESTGVEEYPELPDIPQEADDNPITPGTDYLPEPPPDPETQSTEEYSPMEPPPMLETQSIPEYSPDEPPPAPIPAMQSESEYSPTELSYEPEQQQVESLPDTPESPPLVDIPPEPAPPILDNQIQDEIPPEDVNQQVVSPSLSEDTPEEIPSQTDSLIDTVDPPMEYPPEPESPEIVDYPAMDTPCHTEVEPVPAVIPTATLIQVQSENPPVIEEHPPTPETPPETPAPAVLDDPSQPEESPSSTDNVVPVFSMEHNTQENGSAKKENGESHAQSVPLADIRYIDQSQEDESGDASRQSDDDVKVELIPSDDTDITIVKVSEKSRSDKCSDRVLHCLSQIPCASLIAWIILLVGLGGLTGSLLIGVQKTRDLLESDQILWFTEYSLIGIVVGMFLIGTGLLCVGHISTDPTSRHLFHTTKRNTCAQGLNIFMLVISYILGVAWTVVTSILGIPLFLLLVLLLIKNDVSCINLVNYGLSSKEICHSSLTDFARQGQDLMISYIVAYVSSVLITISLIHFMIVISANLAHLKDRRLATLNAYVETAEEAGNSKHPMVDTTM